MADTTELGHDKVQAQINQLLADTMKLNAESMKLTAEAGKITRETFWYPMLLSTGLIAAVATAILAIQHFFF